MTILPKKQKQKIIVQLLEKIIDAIPGLLKIIVISIIGTYLRWNPILIVTTITAIVGDNILTINISVDKDSKKIN